ncbi:MAG: glycyl-radical enzyme activating protein [Tannerella sp.]|jgi:pyruvate formate lyase activating enzyme|nr:glycyl-radical enzyme activating protein [Tannerella sp.]
MIERNTKELPVSIMEIERFAIHDGPGIRTVVFMQGCPLHCPWCSNPESQQQQTCLSHLKNRCVNCGMCAKACPVNDIVFVKGQVHFLRKKCMLCKSCGDICPQNAIRFIGEKVSTAHIMDIIRRDRCYYQTSGGGVTFSGGEAFVQHKALMALLISCKEEGFHTAIETCGQAEPEKIKEAYPLIDLFLFDIKHTEKERLKKVTGADWDTVCRNLDYLSKADPEKIIIRTPVIPGFNYSTSDITEIYRLALKNGIKRVHLLPYHVLGKDKYAQIGLEYVFPHSATVTKTELFPLKRKGEEMGLHVQIGG